MRPQMTKTRALQLIDFAYSSLDFLNDIKLTSYRDVCYEMARSEEIAHRRQWTNRGGISVNVAARLFVVYRIAQYLSGERRATVADILHFQPSNMYAAAIVEEYREQISAVLSPATVTELLWLDYAQLVETTAQVAA